MKFTDLFMTTVLFASIATPVLANDDHHAHHDMSTSSVTEQRIQATGEVKGIDLATNKVTIAHHPIPALGWPAMTMRFTAEDPTLINQLKVNDQVEFSFVQQGSLSLLRSISVVQ